MWGGVWAEMTRNKSNAQRYDAPSKITSPPFFIFFLPYTDVFFFCELFTLLVRYRGGTFCRHSLLDTYTCGYTNNSFGGWNISWNRYTEIKNSLFISLHIQCYPAKFCWFCSMHFFFPALLVAFFISPLPSFSFPLYHYCYTIFFFFLTTYHENRFAIIEAIRCSLSSVEFLPRLFAFETNIIAWSHWPLLHENWLYFV